jgi:hypothetical protein
MAGDAVAVWGAVTGTVGVFLGASSLIWQVRTRRRAPDPNLKVELSMMAQKPYMFGGVVSDAVLIQVTNLGPLPVRVVAAGFLMQSNEDQEITFGEGYGVRLPADVDAQQGLSILIDYQGARKAVALSKPAIAWVRTDTGHRFISPRVQVIRPGTSGYDENLEPTMLRS